MPEAALTYRPRNPGLTERIRELLETGAVIESKAVGRFGRIVEVKDGAVYIQLDRYRRGVTHFDRGDPLRLEALGTNSWCVVNIWPGEPGYAD